MHCKNCGVELPENAKFCHEYGAKSEQEVVCGSCGTKAPAGYKFCMECGSPLSGGSGNAENGGSEEDVWDIGWESIQIMSEVFDLEEFRKGIKNEIFRLAAGYNCIELQENVIWSPPFLYDLSEFATIKNMKKYVDSDDSKIVWRRHLTNKGWPQWEMYRRELDFSTRWVGGIYGNLFYYITEERDVWGRLYAKLHKCTIGTENKEDIETWNETKIYEDKDGNIRILARNKEDGSCVSEDWILLTDAGKVLWEAEKGKSFMLSGWCAPIGWAVECFGEGEGNNNVMLLDFYTGNILLREYALYTFCIFKPTGEIVIAAEKTFDKLGENYREKYGEHYDAYFIDKLYHYEDGFAAQFRKEEIKNYGIKLPILDKEFRNEKRLLFKEMEGYLMHELEDSGLEKWLRSNVSVRKQGGNLKNDQRKR